MPNDALPDDLETLKAMLLAERCESERLRQIIKELQRHRFGRGAETLPGEQMLLGLEEVEQVEASGEAQRMKPRLMPVQRGAASAAATAEHCRRICRGSRSSSISTTRPAAVATASCTGLARTRASGSTWCRRSSGCSAPSGPNTAADPGGVASSR